MFVAAVAVLLGLALLVWSADLFVAGAASIAENLGLSPTIIGLTIVSLGTSAPEILVSITAALAGAGELAVGNALGSNIANIGLVLGVTLLLVPMIVQTGSIRIELPLLLLVTVAAGLLLVDGDLSRIDGLVLLGALTLILARLVRTELGDKLLRSEREEGALPRLGPTRAWIYFLGGLAALIASSRLLVWGATRIAEQLGVPELVIGLTIIAIGTSLPELAATLASALKGHTEIAIGNVIGSNFFNLLAVMAVPGIIDPLTLSGDVLVRDYPVMTAATFLFAASLWLGLRRQRAPAGSSYLGRGTGLLLTAFYGLYYYWLSFSLQAPAAIP